MGLFGPPGWPVLPWTPGQPRWLYWGGPGVRGRRTTLSSPIPGPRALVPGTADPPPHPLRRLRGRGGSSSLWPVGRGGVEQLLIAGRGPSVGGSSSPGVPGGCGGRVLDPRGSVDPGSAPLEARCLRPPANGVPSGAALGGPAGSDFPIYSRPKAQGRLGGRRGPGGTRGVEGGWLALAIPPSAPRALVPGPHPHLEGAAAPGWGNRAEAFSGLGNFGPRHFRASATLGRGMGG